MNKDLLSLEDLAGKTGAGPDRIADWMKAGLLKPDGFTDGKAPLFAAGIEERVARLQKLSDLGYGTEEIQKIIKKVGLPHDGKGGKKEAGKGRFLTVGNLAERSGVSPRTIKHWEDKGIIEPDMRTEGGFRLYSESYVVLCQLIRDLQLFGYTLEEIKAVSDSVRAFLAIRENLEAFPPQEVAAKLEAMLKDIAVLFSKMGRFKKGIKRWEDLLKKERKEISDLSEKNQKREPKKPKEKKK